MNLNLANVFFWFVAWAFLALVPFLIFGTATAAGIGLAVGLFLCIVGQIIA